MSSDDLTARAESWLESWPGPLRLVSGGRKEQSVPDAHNAAPDLVRDLLAEVKRLTPREITSAEELFEKLTGTPIGTVVRGGDGSLFLRRSKSEIGWFDTESGLSPFSDLFGASYITLPARILYVPEVQS